MKGKVLAAAAISAAIIAAAAFEASAQAPVLDAESAQCVSCHAASYTPGPPPTFCHGDECGHPVGVPYADLALRNPVLERPAALNTAVRLVNGAIACTTCHVPYVDDAEHADKTRARASSPPQPDPMLVIDNAGSALCAACHRV